MSSGSLFGSGGSFMTRVARPSPYLVRMVLMSRHGTRKKRTKPSWYGTFRSRLPLWYASAATRLGVGREQVGLGPEPEAVGEADSLGAVVAGAAGVTATGLARPSQPERIATVRRASQRLRIGGQPNWESAARAGELVNVP